MNTLFIGKNMLFLPEVDSTNTYAINLLRNVNTIEGTVIYTNNQTKGKGQRGAVWLTEIGKNLTFSVILKPRNFSINNSFYLSKITALACYDVLTEILNNSQIDIKIKWPNDILVNQKKIAGILIENNLNGSSIQHSIIGVGLNVNQNKFDELLSSATSIFNETKKEFELHNILNLFCSKLEKWYLMLNENKFDQISNSYLTHLFGLNEINEFSTTDGDPFKGEIIGVNKNGRLEIKKNNSEILNFDVKEVKLL